MATTAQDTYDIFIGSGALDFYWYQEISDDNPREITGDDWSISFTEYSENGPEGSHTISHKLVMRAVRRIASKDSDGIAINGEVRKRCMALVFKGPDAVDFDSGMADAVLQVAVFGEVTYG